MMEETVKSFDSRLKKIKTLAKKRSFTAPSDFPAWITMAELESDSFDDHEMCMAFTRGEPIPKILEMADPICARKILTEGIAPSGYFDDLLIDETIQHPDSQFVQIQHPVKKTWHKIDREKARIIVDKNEPFKDVTVLK